MILVRIIKNWDYPDIFRQSPKGKGIWDGVQFTTKPVSECDYVIVSNFARQNYNVSCSKENVWSLQQEPPNEYFHRRHNADKIYYRVFTTDSSLKEERFIHTQPALPWHIGKTYDELVKIKSISKSKVLSFITSNKNNFSGHKKRLMFLHKIKDKVDFDLFGFGFLPIKDKWDGLYPYKYSLAIENFSCPDYWTEKIADCFLSYTMPIYYGCTNLSDYFPKNSFVQIDINDKNVAKKIDQVSQSNLWQKSSEAIVKARNLVLEKYQFFPFMANQIKNWEEKNKNLKQNKEFVTIPNEEEILTRLSVAVRHKFKI